MPCIFQGNPLQACSEEDYDAQLQLCLDGDRAFSERTYPDLVKFVNNRLKRGRVNGVEFKEIFPNLPYNAEFKGYERSA